MRKEAVDGDTPISVKGQPRPLRKALARPKGGWMETSDAGKPACKKPGHRATHRWPPAKAAE